MGVPAFYRWITEKFSKIITDILEKRPNVIDGTIIPINLNEPNPNETEYDNLFVDMNGLIHPCSHPEDRDAPSTEAEMYVNVCKYVDRLVAAIRPRRLLYLAIDGVAPRAKMNQQRSRRFRASKDMKEKKIMTEEIIADMIELGFPAPAEGGDEWDSNVITPGTEFMSNLTIYLRFYILDRMNRDPYWKNITVILSDASEPGEGEHKIMNFIRNQRSQPGYDPNQYHVLHGLDADLIMLALATHEAHFTILREKVTFGRQKELPEVSEAQRMLDAQSMHNGIRISCLNPSDEWIYSKPLEALDISTLREYLDNDFSCLKSIVTIQYDLERLIDDFIFLCFFVGNDFLPHLPSLDIREGALDFLLECYKELLPSLGGYLTNPGGYVNLRQVDVILGKVGEIEDQIFLMRRKALDGDERRKQERFGGGGHRNNNQSQASSSSSSSSSYAVKTYNSSNTHVSTNGNHNPHNPTHAHASSHQHHHHHHGQVHSNTAEQQQLQLQQATTTTTTPSSFVLEQNKQAAAKLKQSLLGKRSIIDHVVAAGEEGDGEGTSSHATAMEMDYEASKTMTRDGGSSSSSGSGSSGQQPTTAVTVPPTRSMTVAELEAAKVEVKKRLKDKEQAKIDSNKESVVDDVRLHELGWKDRYYGEKHKKENIEKGGGLARMRYSYVQGLCWVLRYYFQGVPSWNWYYPFHYAPFASDLINIDSYGVIEFDLSQPFRPIEQLLAVFPATSVNALPLACRWLMTDSSSPIIDLYDDDIPIDPDGKHLPWLWILLLPFVDEHRITEAFKLCETNLSIEERQRNRFGQPVIFMHKNHRLAIEALATIKYQPSSSTIDVDTYTATTTVTSSSSDDDDIHHMNDDSGGGGGSDDDNNRFDFDAVRGNGMSGLTTPSPALFYSPLQATIISPVDKTNSFRDITENHVICFTYNLHQSGFHLSKLLEGVRPDPTRLSSFDLIRQRPPRLNKSFNISDLFSNNNNNINNNYQVNNNYNNYQGNNNNNYQGNNNNNNQYRNQKQNGNDNYSNSNNNYQGNNSYNNNNYQSNNSYNSMNNYNNKNNYIDNNGYNSNHNNYHNNNTHNNNSNSNNYSYNNNHFNSKAVNNNNYGQYNQQQQQHQQPVQPHHQQYHHQQYQQQQQQQQQQQHQYSTYQSNQAATTITPHNPPAAAYMAVTHTHHHHHHPAAALAVVDHTITSIKDKALQQQIDRSTRMYANPLTSNTTTTNNNNNNNNNRSTSINTNNKTATAAAAAVSSRSSTGKGSTGRTTVYLDEFPVPQQHQASKRKGHSFLDKGHAADNNNNNNNYQANSNKTNNYQTNNNNNNKDKTDYGANQYSHTFAHTNNNNPQYLQQQQQQQQQQQSGQHHQYQYQHTNSIAGNNNNNNQYHQYNPQQQHSSTHHLRPPSSNSSSLPSLSLSQSQSLPTAPASMDAIRDQLRMTLQQNQQQRR